MRLLKLIIVTIIFLFDFSYSQYWQQNVNYKINCNLDTKKHLIEGEEVLIYTNNSPDTLNEVYFHLYQNAYLPDSYMQQQSRQNINDREYLESYPKENWGWTKINYIKYENNEELSVVVSNTIGKVKLTKSLLPGEKITFKINFTTKFSSNMHRMNYKMDAWGNLQYSVAQWYPKICVYDQFKWHVDQHFGHEFYGDFGTFDVNISLPAHFILDATGVLQNKEEALPDDLLKKIDIKNFKDKPMGEKPSIIIPETDNLKTWKFHADNVHDFAWIADPTFRRGFAKWNDVEVVAYAREYKAAKWQDAADFTAKVIEVYSKDFGKYLYPKIIVSDVDNGMEYPMLTMDGGESPGYYGLLAHEVGHNWFYGIVGNNETQEAFLDEGFTQFIESWVMERITDSSGNLRNIKEYLPGSPPYRTDYRKNSCYRSYLNLAKSGFEDKIMTHSDWTREGSAYGVAAYFKPATMLYNLQYVLGDDIFLSAMRQYYSKWAFKHPYHQDFFDVIQNVAGKNLNWFFEQWFNTTRVCDYKISEIDQEKKPDGTYKADITIDRIGDMVMPIDFKISLKDGSILNYTIPVDNFPKHEKNLLILPNWTGWNNWNKKYKATVDLPDKISQLEIDGSHRLSDINRLNNRWPHPEAELLFSDPSLSGDYSFYKISILWRPDLWFNNINKFTLGLKINLEHPRYFISPDITSNLYIGLGVKSLKPNIEFNIKTPNRFAGTLAYNSIYLNIMDGRALGYISFEKDFRNTLNTNNSTSISLSFRHFQVFNEDYCLNPNLWQHGKVNTINLSVSKWQYTDKIQSTNKATFSTTFMGTYYDFSKLILEGITKIYYSDFIVKTKYYIGYTRGDVPLQEQFYIAGASPIDEFSSTFPNAYFRSRGIIPKSLVNEGHIYLEGGTNIRGFQNQNINGTRAAAMNVLISSVYFSNSILTPYIFYDIGNVDSEIRSGFILQFFQPFKHDLGIGIDLKLPSFLNFIGLQNIKCDFPFWISRTYNSEKNLSFRWLLSFNQAF